jgi:hypothetical protein
MKESFTLGKISFSKEAFQILSIRLNQYYVHLLFTLCHYFCLYLHSHLAQLILSRSQLPNSGTKIIQAAFSGTLPGA